MNLRNQARTTNRKTALEWMRGIDVNLRSIVSTCCPAFLRPAFDRIENSPIGSRLARGVFWSLTGAVISRGLGLCATVLVARMLGKTCYGELGIIQSTVGMFGIFAGFSMGLTATKYVAQFRQSDPERAGRIIALSGLFAMGSGALMAVGLLIFAPWLAEHTINAPHLAGLLRISALILFISALNGAQTGALSGFEAFKTVACVNLFIGLISFPIRVCGVYFGGLTGAVWSLAITLVFSWLLNHIALRRQARRHKVPFTFSNCTREWTILWKFSFPAVLGGTLVGPVRWACTALLVNEPDGYSQMGIFTAALVFQGVLSFAGGRMEAPLLSMLSNAGASIPEKLKLVNILSSWIPLTFAVIPFMCFPELVEWLFGNEYGGHGFRVVFVITLFHTWVLSFRSGLGRLLAARDLLWWSCCSNCLWSVISIVCASFLVRYGAVGLAASFAIAHLLITIIVVPFYVSKQLAPASVFISKEALAVWLIVIALTASSFLEIPVITRLIAMPAALFLTGWAFNRIWRLNNANNSSQ